MLNLVQVILLKRTIQGDALGLAKIAVGILFTCDIFREERGASKTAVI